MISQGYAAYQEKQRQLELERKEKAKLEAARKAEEDRLAAIQKAEQEKAEAAAKLQAEQEAALAAAEAEAKAEAQAETSKIVILDEKTTQKDLENIEKFGEDPGQSVKEDDDLYTTRNKSE